MRRSHRVGGLRKTPLFCRLVGGRPAVRGSVNISALDTCSPIAQSKWYSMKF